MKSGKIAWKPLKGGAKGNIPFVLFTKTSIIGGIVFVCSTFIFDSSLLKCHITIDTAKNLIFDTCDWYVINLTPVLDVRQVIFSP